MADTFDSLIVGSAFDPAGFQAGMQRLESLYDGVSERLANRPLLINATFDPREFTADIVSASELARERLGNIFADLAPEAAQAAQAASDELQTALFNRIGLLRERLAAEAISPAAFQRQAQLAVQLYNQEMSRLSTQAPAPLPPPQFNGQAFIEEIIAASDAARKEFNTIISAADLGAEARLAAAAVADQLQTQLLNRLGGLGDALAVEIIDPAAFQRQGDAALAAFSETLGRFAARPLTIPIPQLDAGGFLAEIISVSDQGRNALLAMINARELSAEAQQAAIAIGNSLQTNLLNRLADLRVELANELISPAEFIRQGDAALAAFSQEMVAQASTIRPIPLRVTLQREGDKGIITDADVRQAELFAGVMGEIGGSTRGSNSLAELENQLRSLQGDEKAGIISNNEYADSLARIRAEAIRMKEDGIVQTGPAFTSFNRIMRETDGRIRESAVGMRQLRLGAAQLAVQALGTEGAVGQLAQGLLIFGGGSALVVGVGLGIAAIAGAYRLIFGEARRAREEHEKLADALHQRLDVGTGTSTTTADLQKQIAGAEERRALAAQELATIQARINSDLDEQFFSEANYLRVNVLTSREKKAQFDLDQANLLLRQAQLDLAQKDFETVNQIRRAQTQSLGEFSAGQTQIIAAGLQLNNDHRTTALLLRQQLAIADNLHNTDQERLRALSTYKAGVNDITAAFLRQVTAAQTVGQIQLQQVQRLRTRSEQVDAPITIRADVTQAENGLQQLRQEYTAQIDTLRTLEQRYARNREGVIAWAAQRQQLEQLRQAIDDVMQSAGGREIELAERDLQLFIDRLGRLTPQELEVLVPIHFDDTQAFQDLDTLRTALQRRINQFTAAGVTPPQELVQAFDSISQEIQQAITAPIEALNRSAGLVANRMQALRAVSDAVASGREFETGAPETIGALQDRLRALAPVLEDLRGRYALITAEIDREGGPLRANIELINTQAQLLQQIQGLQFRPSPIEVTQLEPLQRATEAFIAAQNRLDAAVASGNRTAAQRAQGALDAAADRMDQLKRGILDLSTRLGLDAKTTAALVGGIADAYNHAGREAKGLSDRQIRTIRELQSVNKIIGFVDQLTSAFGGTDEQLHNILGSLGNISSSIQDIIANGASFGSVLGLAGAGIGLLNSIFGPSEHDRLLQENNDRLKELAASLDRTQIGAAGEQRAAQAAAALAGTQLPLESQLPGIAFNETLDDARAHINDFLQPFGFTLDQLNALAKSQGITLIDKNGAIAADRLLQFAQAMGIDIDALTSFSNTLADQQRASDIAARLFGSGQDAASVFQRQLSVISQFSPAIADAFKGLDLKNAPEIRAALQGLFSKLDDGFFKAHPELFGGLSRDEFLQFLGQGADFLDSFNQGLADATQRIGDFNIPEGFRRAALAFANSNIGEFQPSAPVAVPGGTQANTQAQPQPPVSQVSVGSVVVHLDAGEHENADELFSQFIEKLRALGMSFDGDNTISSRGF